MEVLEARSQARRPGGLGALLALHALRCPRPRPPHVAGTGLPWPAALPWFSKCPWVLVVRRLLAVTPSISAGQKGRLMLHVHSL